MRNTKTWSKSRENEAGFYNISKNPLNAEKCGLFVANVSDLDTHD